MFPVLHQCLLEGDHMLLGAAYVAMVFMALGMYYITCFTDPGYITVSRRRKKVGFSSTWKNSSRNSSRIHHYHVSCKWCSTHCSSLILVSVEFQINSFDETSPCHCLPPFSIISFGLPLPFLALMFSVITMFSNATILIIWPTALPLFFQVFNLFFCCCKNPYSPDHASNQVYWISYL